MYLVLQFVSAYKVFDEMSKRQCVTYITFLVIAQRIVQLLHQIAQMNELLIKHHKEIVSRR